MSLFLQLEGDIKSAMLGKDSTTVGVLRILKSEIKNAEIAQAAPLEEAQIMQVIRREIKKRQDSFELYTKANRPDRAEQEQTEIKVLEKYLPTQIDPQLVEQYLESTFPSTERSSERRGEMIKAALSHFAGQTDGKTVSALVEKLLQ